MRRALTQIYTSNGDNDIPKYLDTTFASAFHIIETPPPTPKKKTPKETPLFELMHRHFRRSYGEIRIIYMVRLFPCY
jgi:hypothetical protein